MPKSRVISRLITTNSYLTYSELDDGDAGGGDVTGVTAGTEAVELFAESVL
jgi:hypothetical protein